MYSTEGGNQEEGFPLVLVTRIKEYVGRYKYCIWKYIDVNVDIDSDRKKSLCISVSKIYNAIMIYLKHVIFFINNFLKLIKYTYKEGVLTSCIWGVTFTPDEYPWDKISPVIPFRRVNVDLHHISKYKVLIYINERGR